MASLLISEGSDSAAAIGAGEGISSPWLYVKMRSGTRKSRARPRSSPIRLSAASLASPVRSPSASPRLGSPARQNTVNNLSKSHLDCQCCNQKLDWSYTSAYYSVQPPVAPVQLFGTSEIDSSRAESPLHQLKSLRQIDLSPVHRSGNKQRNQPKKKAGSKNRRRLVRLLLRELVTSLPLPVPPPPCHVTYRESTVSPTFFPVTKVSQAEATVSASLISTPLVTPDCKHVAVQAPGNSAADVEDEDYFLDGVQLSSNEEWVGGVRALRDSHVKIVLRQLRHIDRLNRALDRAVPASSLRTARS